ncbi:fumarylacetoacetate hydrolase family protein [Maricaulis sp. D1M11]|uniref:fumarylacetoacetate hydrolase family protein n=1 Tax=Maricaulis sp. D1M11 TaxID=3076117 RepID=UPI0039B38331
MNTSPRTVFAPPAPVCLPVTGMDARFPVHRIFCVGRNYAEHAREMNSPAEPIFFMKPAIAATTAAHLPFPAATNDLHHEVELVIAIGPDGVFGAATGIDLTRRDQQKRMKDKGAPWEIAKSFEASAPIGPIRPGPVPVTGSITLDVDGTRRQTGDLSEMILGGRELLETLNTYFTLQAGDLIFTGTPAGVGPIQPGQTLNARIEGLAPLDVTLDDTGPQ